MSVFPVPGGPQSSIPPGIAALLLDLVRPLEEGDVLLDRVEDMVLAPYVCEPGLDFLG